MLGCAEHTCLSIELSGQEWNECLNEESGNMPSHCQMAKPLPTLVRSVWLLAQTRCSVFWVPIPGLYSFQTKERWDTWGPIQSQISDWVSRATPCNLTPPYLCSNLHKTVLLNVEEDWWSLLDYNYSLITFLYNTSHRGMRKESSTVAIEQILSLDHCGLLFFCRALRSPPVHLHLRTSEPKRSSQYNNPNGHSLTGWIKK